MTVADTHALLSVLPEPMMLTAPDGRILAANAAAASLLKGDAGQLTGMSIAAIAADPPEKVAGTLAQFARCGQFVPAALTFKTAEGEINCRVEGALIHVDGGPVLMLRMLPRDQAVTRFRSLNERIETLNREVFERTRAAETAEMLRAIVDSCDDAVVSKDLNGIIKSWNKGAERLFGYTAEEAVGRPITMIIPTDRLQEEPAILERLRRGERVDHFETIRVRKDGSEADISLSISPVRDESGRVTGASKIARDITERKRQEQALAAVNTALTRSNADLQQFAYSASHDLQEPLRMVSTYGELLKREFGGQLGARGDEYIGYTIQGALRMEQLLRDLRSYTLASSAGQNPTEDIEAGQSLDKALAALESAVKESGACVTRTALPRVRLHEFQMEQIFQNLIGNSIHYRSSEPPRIHIAAEPRGKDWLFSVRDNGIGIDPQYKEQIFEIFKRLHSAAAYPGTGMGLAICQRIVERAGGRIWVESELDRGSTFFFTIPRGGD
jgi:PAS domain S-box-containing protein